MPDQINMGVTIVDQTTIGGLEEYKALLNTISKLSLSPELKRYWKDVTQLEKDAYNAAEAFGKSVKSGAPDASLAERFVKVANALQGISGKSLGEVNSELAKYNDLLQKAVSLTPKTAIAFDKQIFADLKSAYDDLEKIRDGLGKSFIQQIGESANVGNLRTQLRESIEASEKLKTELQQVKDTTASLRVKELQQDLDKANASIDNMRSTQYDELYSFLSANNISPDLPKIEALLNEVSAGIKTYNEAKTELMAEFADKLSGQTMQSQLTEISQIVHQLAKDFQTAGNAGQSAFSGISRGISQIPVVGTAQGSSDGIGTLLHSLKNAEHIDATKLEAIGHALSGIGRLDGIKISSATVKNLTGALDALDKVESSDKVIALSHLDWSGWANLKVSQASIKNLADYLPIITKDVDVSVLERIANLPTDTFLANLNALSGKDIKFRFDTAMGDESGALADSTKRFADHTEQVYKAVDAEKAKEEQAVKLTEVLGREAMALTKVEAGQPTATNAILGGLHQPFGSTERNIQELTDGLKRVGIADADILRIVQSMDSFDASVAKVKTQVNETTGELLTMEITAKNAANTATTVWKGFFNGKDKKWEWRNNTSYDLAKEQSQAAKAEAEEQKRIAAEMAAMWAEYERERQAEIREETNISYKEYEQQAKDVEESTKRQIEAYYGVEEAKRSAQKGIESDNAAAAKSEAEEQKRIAADTAAAYKVLNDEREREAAQKRSQAAAGEQYTKKLEQEAREEVEIAKRTARELEQYYAPNDREYEQYIKRLEAIHRREVKLRQQAQASARETWQQANAYISETTPSLRLNVDKTSRKELDDLRKELAAAFGDLRNLSEAAVKDGSLQFSDEQIKSLNVLNTLLERYINKRTELLRLSKNNSGASSDELAVAKVQNKVASTWERYRSAIEKSADSLAKFQNIQKRANNLQAGDADGVKKLTKDLADFTTDLIKSGATVDSFMRKLSKGFAGKLFYGVLARASMYVRQFARQIVTNVKEVNTALTQLQIVTRGTSNDMVAYFDRAAESAQRLGVSMKDLIDSTTTFARLGYSAEESSMLADYVAMLTKVGAIDTSDATDAVTAMVKAFDIELEDLQSVMDKMVIVGNNFPISVSQIAEGMNNASSALAAAGNSVEESMALLTAANTTVQNISKSSTGLRTIAARLRKTVVSDDGEEEAMSESDYNDLVKALTKQKVALTDINGEYRSTYDIIQDIAAVWDSMSSIDQAALAEKLAGTRQQNIFYSLVGQFKEAQGAVEATTEAGGEMAAAYDVYLDSVEGKLGKLNATFQVFSNDFLSSDTFNAVLNFGNGMLGVADALAKVNALLPLLATGIMARKAYTSIAATEGFRDVLKGLVEQNTELGKQSGLLTKLKAAWKSMGTGMKAALIGGIAVTAISTVIGFIQQESEARKKAAEEDYRSFTKSSEAIEDYKTKIKELKEQLDKGNLSEEQAYEVRKELLGIQDDMIEKLGDEAGAFDILHDSITEVNSALDRYHQNSAVANLRDNNRFYQDALRVYNSTSQNLGVFGDSLFLGARDDVIAQIYQSAFGARFGIRNGAMYVNPGPRGETIEQLRDVYKRIFQLDQAGLSGKYSNELKLVSTAIEQMSALPLLTQWTTGFQNFSDVEAAIQQYVTQTIAADAILADQYKKINAARTDFTNALADEDYSLAQSIYNEIKELNFGSIADEHVRAYFENLQSAFTKDADTYMIDINLRTRIVSSGALPALQGAVAPFGGDEIALRSAEQDSSELSDEQRAAYLQLNEVAEANGVTFDHLIDILIDLGVVTKRVTADTKDFAEALTITQLDTTRGVVKSFHDAWTSMTNDGEVAFDKLRGIFSSLTDKDGKEMVEGLDEYISRLAELRGDIPATEAVLNELFATYVSGQIDADSLAESDLDVVEAMLKEAGVANETEVALAMVVKAKLDAAEANGTLLDASGNLNSVLLDEIQALVGEGNVSAYTAQKLAELELQKIILSNNPLNMTSSISTLSALAGQSTTTAAALAGLFAAVEKVQSINSRIESLEAQLSPDITKGYYSEAERIGRVMDELAALRGQQTSFSSLIMTEAKRAMEELSSALPSTGIQWTPPTAGGSGSGGSTKTFADTLKERYEAENKSLEAQLDLLKHQYDEYRRIGDDDRANQNLRDQAAIYDIIMANAHDAAEELRNYYLSLGLTLDEINKQADVLEYSNIWWDAYENKLALVQQQLDDLKQSLDDVTGELDSFQNIYKTLISAAEQYHTDGFLHVDTLKEILAFGPEYLQFLSDENGQLSYNEEALQKVIAAKTEEMAIDTALMYLRRVMSAVEISNANELKKLADITNLTAQNTWALVDAQLALVKDKVSEQYYNNISTNINRLKSLTVSATSAISQYGDSLHSSYMSQKDGMEQLFDIVKEYVKWENEHHIELLEEEKKKYGELVDKKKEMLDLAKSEDDHNKSVAKKLKEIAELETRIALLELDDSREAQAEKSKLQKELAEKNDDLTDSQQSYYIDKQKEALDKDKENFEKKKDAEIDILKKELNTEEKLYQATLKRIQTEWTNGWGNFYNTLKQWNVEYGSHLSSTLAGVLDKASEAIGQWGDPLTALQQVGNDELIGDTRGQMRANALRWWTTFGAERDSLPGENQRLADIFNEMTGLGLTPRNGAWYLGDGSRFFELSKDEIAAAIIAAMQANSAGWFTASKEEQQVLAQNNVDLAARLGEVLGEILTRKDGVWYRADGTRLYSEGGVADYTGTAILHGGKAAELVLNNADVSKVYDLIHNTPSLVGSFFSKMLGNANSAFRNGNYGTGGGDINMDFNVTINHTGGMSDADARRYGDTIASAALDKLRDTFSKRGVRSVGPATLKA